MAAPKSQNADAFDDLLGQLVDELAMTPTMVPEPEPEPEPEPPPPPPVQEVYQPIIQEAPPPRSNLVPIAVGGGIAVAGIAIALVLALKGDPPPPPAEKKEPVAEQKKEPTPPPAAPTTPVPAVAGTPAGPGVPGQPAIPGQPLPGQPGAVPDPNAPATTPAATDTKKSAKPKPKKTGGGGGGSTTKKAEPTKAKPKVEDPFG